MPEATKFTLVTPQSTIKQVLVRFVVTALQLPECFQQQLHHKLLQGLASSAAIANCIDRDTRYSTSIAHSADVPATVQG